MCCCPFLSPTPQKRLKRAQNYLNKARNETKQDSKEKHCNRAEIELSEIKDEMRESLISKDQTLCSDISKAYFDLSELFRSFGQDSRAQNKLIQAKDWQCISDTDGRLASSTTPGQLCPGIVPLQTHNHFTHAFPGNGSSTQQAHNHYTHVLPGNNNTQETHNHSTYTLPGNDDTQQIHNHSTYTLPGNNNTQETHNHSTHALPGNDDTQHIHSPSTQAPPVNNAQKTHSNITPALSDIFPQNIERPKVDINLPKRGERIGSTSQLAYCLKLLLPNDPTPLASSSLSLPTVHPEEGSQCVWVLSAEGEKRDLERLREMTANIVKLFIKDSLKDPPIVAEVVHLAPVLEKNHYRKLLNTFIDGIGKSTLLDLSLLEGLTQLIQSSTPGYLMADDLVRILRVLKICLQDTHQQTIQHLYDLTLVVSRVLDSMADSGVNGLSREQLHAPLSAYLDGLKDSSDPYLMYQAAYAYQALQYVPDDETSLQAVLRRTVDVAGGISGFVSAVKGLDLGRCLEGLMKLGEKLKDIKRYTKAGYEGVASRLESDHKLLDIIKDGPSFSHRRTWYPALRATDDLIRDGRFADFKRLVCEAPCRYDLEFQWGLCQRLGEIAVSQLWGASTILNAIDFLGEIYKNDTDWGDHASIKQLILTILRQLSGWPECGIWRHPGALLEELETNGDAGKKELYRACKQRPQLNPLKIYIPPTSSTSLIERAQDIPEIEDDLYKLKGHQPAGCDKDIYIPLWTRTNTQASNGEHSLLMDCVKEFLDSERQVLLLLSNSGGGKTTFSRELERDLWNNYRKGESRIPLHINLSTIDRPDQDLIVKHLRKNDFTEPQIREMKNYRAFTLICDGYDESQQSHNLYNSNQLNQPGQWQAKMIISSRSEYLGADRDHFQPIDRDKRAAPNLFQEVVIAPFSAIQIQDYIKEYVFQNRPLWQSEDYLEALSKVPNLMDLVKNPFLLTLSLEVLPRVVNVGQIQDLSGARITRVALYDQFVKQWLERGKKRVGGNGLSQQAKAAFDTLVDGGFTQSGIHFLKKLASAIYKEQEGRPVVEYSRFRDEGTWKTAFFSREDEIRLLREACPLIRNGNQYQFIHRSLLEYCFALAVFDPQDSKALHSSDVPVQDTIVDGPLSWKSFVGEISILELLVERVRKEPDFKKHLRAMIERSKIDNRGSTAAANAITIMVRAGIRFNGEDLRGIRIPGADLSCGEFDRAQLQGADLRKVNLCNIWLREADLSDAQMADIQFGEWPHLSENNGVLVCAFSLDGGTCALGLEDGTINLYDTNTWERIHTLSVHFSQGTSVTFSPTFQQVAFIMVDKTIQLRDMKSSTVHQTLSARGHTDTACTVAYSLSGQQIASGSRDNTIRLWDARNGTLKHTLKKHTDHVTSVAYSSDGLHIASGSLDKTVCLWSTQTGTSDHVLVKHTEGVRCVVYSPDSQQIASGSDDKTVRLWDTQTGTPGHILRGHTDTIRSVVYSPDSQQIASGSDDKTVRLWDTQTGALSHVLNGHTDRVTSVVYSFDGQKIASGSLDKTMRLWSTRKGSPGPEISGHIGPVKSVAYSLDGQQVASGGSDKSVCLWNTQTGTPSRILRGHTDTVRSVAYSSDGQHIASGSDDKTVRLWDTQTGTPGHVLNHDHGITSVVYSHDGRQVVSGTDDNMVLLWNTQSGQPIPTLKRHTGRVTCLAYSPCDKQIASGSDDTTVKLWNATNGKYSRTLKGHTDSVTSVVYSPDHNHIASGSLDNTIRLWEKQKRRNPQVITTTSAVLSVMYLSNGERIASSGGDWTVVIRDVVSGRCLLVVDEFHGPVNSIAWCKTPDGSYLATGCGDTSIRAWKVTETERLHACLHWSSTHGRLIVSGTIIQNPQNLSITNERLLTMRGACIKK